MDILKLIERLTALSDSNPDMSSMINNILIMVIALAVIQTVTDTIIKISKFISSMLPGRDRVDDDASANDIITRLGIDGSISQILRDVTSNPGIHRAILFQFHNGVVMKSGMPFEYVVITHEAVSPGVATSTLNGKHHEMLIFGELISHICNDEVFTSTIEDFRDPLKSIFSDDGNTSVCVKVVRDILDERSILGFILFSNMKDGIFPKNISEIMTQSSDRVAGILSNIWGRCEFCENSKSCKTRKKRKGQELTRCSKMVPSKKRTTGSSNGKK